MKKLFIICLLSAAAVVQTGFCRSEIPADDTGGSTGMQTHCKGVASEDAPMYQVIKGEDNDSFCALYTWNPTPYNVAMTLIFRYYDSSEWHEYYYHMSAYRKRYLEASFPKLIVIDDEHSSYEILTTPSLEL